MADSIVSPSPSTYQVDTARGDQGITYHVVVYCEPVASFNNPSEPYRSPGVQRDKLVPLQLIVFERLGG